MPANVPGIAVFAQGAEVTWLGPDGAVSFIESEGLDPLILTPWEELSEGRHEIIVRAGAREEIIELFVTPAAPLPRELGSLAVRAQEEGLLPFDAPDGRCYVDRLAVYRDVSLVPSEEALPWLDVIQMNVTQDGGAVNGFDASPFSQNLRARMLCDSLETHQVDLAIMGTIPGLDTVYATNSIRTEFTCSDLAQEPLPAPFEPSPEPIEEEPYDEHTRTPPEEPGALPGTFLGCSAGGAGTTTSFGMLLFGMLFFRRRR